MKQVSLLLISLVVAQHSEAQFYSSATVGNSGGVVSDYSAQWYNAAAGSYTGSSAGIFEHYGPSTSTFVNYGSYSYSTGGMADKFLGPAGAAGAQEIGGTAAPQFYDLVLNNGSTSTIAVTNAAGAQVANSVIFSNGITTTVRSNAATGALAFGAGASWSGMLGTGRHVNGYVARTGTSAFTFPVGDGTQYRPLAYTTPPANGTDNLAVAYVAGDAGTVLDPTGGAHNRASISTAGVPGSTQIASVSAVGFWDWVPVSGTSAISFTVSIPDMSSSFTSPSGMRVVGWSTATNKWENLSGSTGASSTAAGTLMSASVSNMSSYSAIAIGSVSQTALPLTYTGFEARVADCRVTLRWEAACDCERFDLERSADGAAWENVGRLKASADGAAYQFLDEHALQGRAYYRIRLTHTDKSYSYSAVLLAQNDCGTLPGVTVAPNPFADVLTISGMAPGTTIRISTTDGKRMFIGNADDKVTIPTEGWLAGSYIVRVTRGTKEVRTVQVVKR
jgi:hypothetical protein